MAAASPPQPPDCACTYASHDAQAASVLAPWLALTAHADLDARADALLRFDPLALARAEHAAGRFVFAEVGSCFGGRVPGVHLSSREGHCYPAVAIEGADGPNAGPETRLNDVSEAFASRYNAELLRLLRASCADATAQARSKKRSQR